MGGGVSADEGGRVTTVETSADMEPIGMSWSRSTTPLEAVERALYALADQATGTVTDEDESWKVLVYPRSSTANRDGLAHRLRQEVTDQALRLRIAERTDPVRNLVFALAFSRAPRTLKDDSPASDS
jgi:His-Xaa-Ser system protein HxsD